MGVQDYSSTPGDNTAISGIPLGQGAMLAEKTNNVFQQMMADLAAASKSVTTFATLRSATQHATGDIIQTLGGAAQGDGRGGVFEWDAAETEADDGGVFIKPDDVDSGDPGRWVRVVEEAVEVAWYTAVGADAVAGSNAAVAAAIALGVNAIHYRARAWLFSSNASVLIEDANNFTITASPRARFTKSNQSFYPMWQLERCDDCSIVMPGAKVTVTTVEAITVAYTASPQVVQTTWPVHNIWDVSTYTTLTDTTKLYTHRASANWSNSVNGTTHICTTTRTETTGSAEFWTIETPVNRQPVVLFVDCNRALYDGLVIINGAIVSRADTQTVNDLVIRNGRASHIHIASLNNHVDQWRQASYAPGTTYTHNRWTIKDFKCIGELTDAWYGNGVHEEETGGTATGRYLKFYERVEGILVDGYASDGKIIDVDCHYNRGDGLWLFSANGCIVSNLSVKVSGLSGIGLENSTGATKSRRCVFSGCEVVFSTWDGVDCNSGPSQPVGGVAKLRPYENFYENAEHIFTGCRFLGNGIRSLSLRADSVAGEGGMGIWMWRVGMVTISGCRVSGSNFSGVGMNGCHAITVTGNQIYNNGRETENGDATLHAGVSVNGAQNSLVADNNFCGSNDDPGLLGQLFGVLDRVLIATDIYSVSSPYPSYAVETSGNRLGPNTWDVPKYFVMPTAGQTAYTLKWALGAATGLLYLRYVVNCGDIWRASTGYSVGDAVFNGVYVYRCTTSGTSAGSGGPTGTSAGTEVDGSVTWTWVGRTLSVGAYLTEGVDYTVSGLGTATVTVTLAVAPTPGNKIEFSLLQGALASGAVATYGIKQFVHLLNRAGYTGGAFQQQMVPWIATSTASRPTTVDAFSYGLPAWDTTLGRHGYWNGTAWVRSDGRQLDKAIRGTTAARPTGLNSTTDQGFSYFDTDLTYSIEWDGAAWVKYDGTAA